MDRLWTVLPDEGVGLLSKSLGHRAVGRHDAVLIIHEEHVEGEDVEDQLQGNRRGARFRSVRCLVLYFFLSRECPSRSLFDFRIFLFPHRDEWQICAISIPRRS